MELLQKFAAVEIQAGQRMTEADRDYCERHQKAYETALNSFKELAFFWEDMNKAQRELLGDSTGPFYHNYLASHNGPAISDCSINNHIEALHTDFIANLTHYFNETYCVSVDASEVATALLPEKPGGRWRDSYVEDVKAYHARMQLLAVCYQHVLEQIVLRLDGRSFSEQAFYELYTRCHSAAWNTCRQEPEFERKKDTICFTGYFCRFRDWPYDGWEVCDGMKDILRGLAHYETDSYRTLPLGFSDFFHYHSIKEPVIEFPTCKKAARIKLFKNNRVDVKFRSSQFAEQFVNKYLGTVC